MLRIVKLPAWLLAACLLTVAACTSTVSRVDNIATQHGFKADVVKGKSFRHRVYANMQNDATRPLHVYLEGDGIPWWNKTTVSPDPTPRTPLMLNLMALDSAPSVYLGRPCYHGFASDPGCNPLLWTHQRYSPEIIDSLSAVLDNILRTRKNKQVVLIGYSGGGAIAMLLATRHPEVEAVVTLAGLIDTSAWTQHHGYSPLKGSMNPVEHARLGSSVQQKHYVGEDDQIVPASLMQPAHARLKTGGLTRLPAVDHACCWEKLWPGLLKQLP